MRAGLASLRRTQAPDGSWTPLWFGNQHASDHANPVYGTARVLAALLDFSPRETPLLARAADFLAAAQNSDGGWGGAKGIESTIEETALAVNALSRCPAEKARTKRVLRGCDWLAERIAEGALARGAPIGLYFASLWYAEELYPVIWSTAALGAALRLIDPETNGSDA
jgi:squalene-hopene/tetraprenyl-beta-curcumene cyclase